MTNQEVLLHKEFSGFVRFFHWVRAISIFILIATGFYIAYPFLQPKSSFYKEMYFLQAYIRSFHIMFGFLLISALCFRIYLFFFDKGSLLERASLAQVFSLKTWLNQIKAYFFLSNSPAHHGAYNPVQFVAYLFLIALMILVSLSGVVLYSHVYHSGLGVILGDIFGWFEVLCGGLANVRFIHHLATWGFILFVPVHVYMVFFHSIRYKGSGVDAMVNGYTYTKE
ncbi:Ni/Fe-hydrogenase, b-type cytochrome subunit [Helicobacter cetorum]|uniref:Ni/Fe-hydrogenase, b-type cytochrome subunit n=1 Tax=Helicobacter cetorum (strain ATCC BAA-429 / MIT 00-7128) TaxID=182217 RepID=I0ENH2_HELC0|nr:Ni/Fe-hydrogenase, b-type cytochrome subunit [Helicobacter cetorum]AFI04491.1 Ni/Fe-hydrogenase, b-type cytochrome subunit [Helicobacter cetorum MIT 00-7128]